MLVTLKIVVVKDKKCLNRVLFLYMIFNYLLSFVVVAVVYFYLSMTVSLYQPLANVIGPALPVELFLLQPVESSFLIVTTILAVDLHQYHLDHLCKRCASLTSEWCIFNMR